MMSKFNYGWKMFIICLKNTTEILQHGRKVNYLKILFVELVSRLTQWSSKFYDEEDETNLTSQYIFTTNLKTKVKVEKKFGNSSEL